MTTEEIVSALFTRLDSIDKNVTVIAARLDAIEPEIDNMAIVVRSIATDVHDLRERQREVADTHGRQLRALSSSNGHE